MPDRRYILVFLMAFSLLVSVSGYAADLSLPAQLVIYRAQVLMQKGKITEAAKVLEKFQKKGKTKERNSKGYRNYMVNFVLGNCYLKAKRTTDAADQYRLAVTARPRFAPAWMNLGKCYYDIKAYLKAGNAFLKGYETAKEKRPERLYYAAICFLSAGKNKEALEVFGHLMQLYPTAIKLDWKEAIVQAYLACNEPKKALPIIEELSEKTTGKRQRQWQEVRLQEYISLGMEAKALKYVSRLIQDYPLEPKWWKGLAYLYLTQNQYRPALVALTIKGLIEPLTIQETRTVAELNMSLGIPVQALHLYKEIASERFGPDMAYRIAQVYIRIHQPQNALNWVEKGLLKKRDPKLMLLKADLLYELARYHDAAEVFEIAARRDIDPGRSWLMAGYAAWNAKETAKSRQAFIHAARYPKQKDAAQKALRQIDS
ncbi:MAG: tetratricopeptide repeat protein [Nitrospiraceae bacterium]|nr:tetratricopeptide repeat protein [Nitrospiraceae bacterium]